MQTAGATEAQAKACLALAEISAEDASFVDAVRALGVSDPLLDEGLEELVRVVEAARAHQPGLLVADLKIARGLDYYTGTVYETPLRGYERFGSICSGGRYDNLAIVGHRPLPGRRHLASGVSRMLGAAVRRGRAVGVPLGADLRAGRGAGRGAPAPQRPDRGRAAAAGHRHRGVAVRGEVRQADPVRRAARHPVRRGSRGADGARDEVKDIRSGEQVAADAAAWTPPDDDLASRTAPPSWTSSASRSK